MPVLTSKFLLASYPNTSPGRLHGVASFFLLAMANAGCIFHHQGKLQLVKIWGIAEMLLLRVQYEHAQRLSSQSIQLLACFHDIDVLNAGEPTER